MNFITHSIPYKALFIYHQPYLILKTDKEIRTYPQ